MSTHDHSSDSHAVPTQVQEPGVESCSVCRFSRPGARETERGSFPALACHRMPPDWPLVTASDWCGEFKPALSEEDDEIHYYFGGDAPVVYVSRKNPDGTYSEVPK